MKFFRASKWMITCACVTLSLFAVTMGIAQAEDWKRYPGSSCQPTEIADGTDYYNLYGGIQNPTSSTLTVLCPIVRDHHGAGEGPKSVKIRAFAIVAHQEVSCRLVKREKWGTFLWGSEVISKTTGELHISAGSGCSGGCLSDLSPTYFYLTCSLPPRHIRSYPKIDSYIVYERD